MKEPSWIDKEALVLLHGASLARFGGAEGIRDEGLLESALNRPMNQFHYEKQNDLADLAAAYAFALVKNHPFVDGNKRVAFLACGVFLAINKKKLDVPPTEAIAAIMSLADSSMTEKAFAVWLRNNLTKG